jgi:hypothetical protein
MGNPDILETVVLSNVYLLSIVCSVSCVTNVSSISGLSILDCLSVLSNVYLLPIVCKPRDNQEWTTQIYWKHWSHKTQDIQ